VRRIIADAGTDPKDKGESSRPRLAPRRHRRRGPESPAGGPMQGLYAGFASPCMKVLRISTGIGNTMVEFFSVPISVSVCR